MAEEIQMSQSEPRSENDSKEAFKSKETLESNDDIEKLRAELKDKLGTFSMDSLLKVFLAKKMETIESEHHKSLHSKKRSTSKEKSKKHSKHKHKKKHKSKSEHKKKKKKDRKYDKGDGDESDSHSSSEEPELQVHEPGGLPKQDGHTGIEMTKIELENEAPSADGALSLSKVVSSGQNNNNNSTFDEEGRELEAKCRISSQVLIPTEETQHKLVLHGDEVIVGHSTVAVEENKDDTKKVMSSNKDSDVTRGTKDEIQKQIHSDCQHGQDTREVNNCEHQKLKDGHDKICDKSFRHGLKQSGPDVGDGIASTRYSENSNKDCTERSFSAKIGSGESECSVERVNVDTDRKEKRLVIPERSSKERDKVSIKSRLGIPNKEKECIEKTSLRNSSEKKRDVDHGRGRDDKDCSSSRSKCSRERSRECENSVRDRHRDRKDSNRSESKRNKDHESSSRSVQLHKEDVRKTDHHKERDRKVDRHEERSRRSDRVDYDMHDGVDRHKHKKHKRKRDRSVELLYEESPKHKVLLSDIEISDDTDEVLLKRLNTSIRKGQELKAEMDLQQAAFGQHSIDKDPVSQEPEQLESDPSLLNSIPLPPPPESAPDLKDLPSNTLVNNSTEHADTGSSAVVSNKKLVKIDIKISQTSAAIISSGVKIENKLTETNLEEGELESSDEGKDVVKLPPHMVPIHDGLANVSEKALPEVKKEEVKEEKPKKKEKHKSKRSHSRSASRSPKKRRHSSRSESPKRRSKKSSSKSRSHKNDKRLRSSSRDRKTRTHSAKERSSRSRSRSRTRRELIDDRSRRRNSSRERYDRQRNRRRSSSHDRNKRSSSRGREPIIDLRLKIDKAKLREIAIKNAFNNMCTGTGPTLELKPDEVASFRAGGKSVEELTDFCKKIAQREKKHDGKDERESEEERPLSDTEEEVPFTTLIKNKDIVFNIRNARQLPILTNQEKFAKTAELRTQFPVSSGSQHRSKEPDWVPVEKSSQPAAATVKPSGQASETVAAVPEDKVFVDPPPANIDVSAVVSERLSALRKLQSNPNDVVALGSVYKAQKKMQQWAESKQLPGQFLGSTGVQILSQQQLMGNNPRHQAWVKKDTFTKALPLNSGIGKLLLQRMGWKEGEGLGKNNEGMKVPLQLDIKMDRKGLIAVEEEKKKNQQMVQQQCQRQKQMTGYLDLTNKHPVSALTELCTKRKWAMPEFIVLDEIGPSHSKQFRFKVLMNGVEYLPASGSANKKAAKMEAALVCLQELGLVPKN